MGRRQARHLRPWRLRTTMVVVLAAVVLLAALSTVAFVQVSRRRAQVVVTVMVAGVPRGVKVPEPATVAMVLRAAEVVPRDGRLLSLVTRTVLDAAARPAVFVLDGQPAGLDAIVTSGATVGVDEPPDIVEDTVEEGDTVPAPPLPEVIDSLWHPGQPGRAISRKGAVSGEIVDQKELQAPVPPARVTEKLVALTFDDGPWPTTPEVLRILREKNVKATFCVITRQLKGGGLASAKGALGEGHQICNHTVGHDVKLPTKPQKFIDEQIIGGNAQLQERLGIKPTYYRPPGGSLGANVIATAKAQGQTVMLWSVDTKDYRKPPPEEIIGTVVGQVKPGAIVLMHDGGGDRNNTLAALPVLIDQLRAAGYEFVLPDNVAPVAAAPVGPAA